MKGRINKRFLENLHTFARRNHPDYTFTTSEAEELYITQHREPHEGTGRASDTYWARMSARNTLTMAVQRGFLERVERGHYRFPQLVL